MLNRCKVIIAISITLLIFAIFMTSVLSKEHWLFAPASKNIAIHIVIDNRTDQPIGPFVIADSHASAPVPINKIESFSLADVDYEISIASGENGVIMIDSNGKRYSINSYFENGLKGRVDIRVECATSDGLSGKRRELTSGYSSFQWESWGTVVCE